MLHNLAPTLGKIGGSPSFQLSVTVEAILHPIVMPNYGRVYGVNLAVEMGVGVKMANKSLCNFLSTSFRNKMIRTITGKMLMKVFFKNMRRTWPYFRNFPKTMTIIVQ